MPLTGDKQVTSVASVDLFRKKIESDLFLGFLPLGHPLLRDIHISLFVIFYKSLASPCGLKCKDPSAMKIDSQDEVQCP